MWIRFAPSIRSAHPGRGVLKQVSPLVEVLESRWNPTEIGSSILGTTGPLLVPANSDDLIRSTPINQIQTGIEVNVIKPRPVFVMPASGGGHRPMESEGPEGPFVRRVSDVGDAWMDEVFEDMETPTTPKPMPRDAVPPASPGDTITWLWSESTRDVSESEEVLACAASEAGYEE